MQVYLGVDGGGTQTRSLLVDARGQVIGRGVGGPSNIHHVDDATLRATLRDVIAQANAGIDPGTVELAAACFGLAGLSTVAAQAKLSSVLAELALAPTHGVTLRTDAEIALTGAFPGECGMILIAGTGSVCFGRDSGGHVYRSGGWGSIADDGGSGSWIGQRALQCAVRQADQREASTGLKQAVFDQLNIQSLEEIISRLHQPPISKAVLAALAPMVLRIAESGDAAADRIVQSALDELVNLAQTTLQKMQTGETALALLGGLAEGSVYFAKHLEQRLHQTTAMIRIVRPRLAALPGAVLEAHLHQHHTIDEDFLRNLKRGLD
jgi:N-acetylglucosamine kinase-like BadF-type ATPase